MSPKASRTAASKVVSICLVIILVCLSSHVSFATLALDPTFGPGGRVTVSFPDATTNYSSQGLRIFVQPSGRILGVGGFTNNGPDGQFPGVVWVGMTTGGGLDTTFGLGATVRAWEGHVLQTLGDALMYPDGRTVRVSQYFSLGGNSSPKAVRLTVDGAPDEPFASNADVGGRNEIPLEALVRTDGKILVLVGDTAHTLFRLNADGTRDQSFGTNGAMPMPFNRIPGQKFDMSMAELPDGRIMIAGSLNRSNLGTFPEFYMIRLSPTGHIDKSFGRQGVLRLAFSSGAGEIRSMVLQPDGKILLVGGITDFGDTDTLLMRFTRSGKADATFGNLGVVISDFAPEGYDLAHAVVLSADGKLRIAGRAGTPSSFVIARYSAAGVLEDHLLTPFTAGHDSVAHDLTIQADAKILAIGFTKNPNSAINGNVFAIARFTE